jgi:hypothetical protein
MGQVIDLGRLMGKDLRREKRKREIRAEMASILEGAVDMDTGLPISKERARKAVGEILDQFK